MTEDQSHWENRNLTSAENLKLATAWKPTLSSSIVVTYPYFNQGKWVLLWYIPNTSWTSWWVVEYRAKEKYTASMASSNKKTKQNLSESDSENDTADFAKFIVIESLKAIYQAKFLPFLIEKVISKKATLKTVKKTRKGKFLVEVDSWKQAESILKMKTFPTTNEIRMKNSTLPKELSGVGSWHWLQKRR